MERKNWEVEDFAEGRNNLPQGYRWNAVSRPDGLAVIEVSLDPKFGTRREEPRNPDNPIIAIPTSWDDAIRLAVQITEMAQAAGEPLPPGVFVKGATH